MTTLGKKMAFNRYLKMARRIHLRKLFRHWK